jgi:hypothetical protein
MHTSTERCKESTCSKECKINRSFYEVEVATARVENRFPHLIEDKNACTIEREDKIELEIKARKSRRNTQGSLRKLGHQIRRHVKPNTAKKSSLTRVVFPDDGPEGLWKQIIGNDGVDDHLIARNAEQFFHAGTTQFGYTELAKNWITMQTPQWHNRFTMEHWNMTN